MKGRLAGMKYYGLATVLKLGLLAMWFGPVFFHPNDYFLQYVGDGLTPYYVIPYAVKYGEGAHFAGYAYPYGAPLMYAATPVMVWMGSLVDAIWPLDTYIRAYVNLFVIFSFLPCVWIVLRMLRELTLPWMWAIPLGLIISAMTPQVLRVMGHYSLCQSFMVPLFMWLVYRMLYGNRQQQIRAFGLYVVAALIGGFLHPYYPWIGGAFLCSSLLVYGIQFGTSKRLDGLDYVWLILLAIVPLLAIWGYTHLGFKGATDFVTHPFGLGHYYAGVESLFIPRFEPYWSWWKSLINIKRLGMEGYAYVGFPGLIFAFWWLGRLIKMVWQRRPDRILRPVLPDIIRTTIWAIILLLPYAYSYPFQFQPDWGKWAIGLNDFRSTGRLAWLFYYGWMLLASWTLYALFRKARVGGEKIQRKWLWGGLAVMVCMSWCATIYSAAKPQRELFLKTSAHQFPETQLDAHQVLAQAGIDPTSYQAMLVLPFFQGGGGKFHTEDFEAQRYGLAWSTQLGIPLINSRLARSALSESMHITAWTSHPLIDKTATLRDLPSDRPLLLLAVKGLSLPGESFLVTQAQLLLDTLGVQLYALKPSQLKDSHMQTEAWQTLHTKDSTWIERNNFWQEDTFRAFYFESFGDDPLKLGNQLGLVGKNLPPILDTRLPSMTDTAWNFSAWVWMDPSTHYLPDFWVSYWVDSNLHHQENVRLTDLRDFVGDWGRIGFKLKTAPPINRISIHFRRRSFRIDNVALLPQDLELWYAKPGNPSLLYNNYLYRPFQEELP